MTLDLEAIRIRAKRTSPEAQARKLATVIYPGVLKPFAQSFFNRNNIWEQKLQASILNEQPIQMIGFWGIGGKQRPDKYDEQLLTEYEAIRESIRPHHPQAADMMLILANSHGRFNGYQGFDEYLETIAADANRRGIATALLDDLYKEWNIELPSSLKPIDRLSNEWKDFSNGLKQEEFAHSRNHRGGRPLTQLVESAGKHSQVSIAPEDSAFHYWQMRRQEREPLAQSFLNAILLVNGSEDLGRETLPLNMPHMYMKIGPVWFQHD